MRRRQAAVIVLCMAVLGQVVPLAVGQQIPDDHGNVWWDATPLSGNSNSIAGVLDYDMDSDWFSFPFLPWRSYLIRVQTGTVWDVVLQLRPPAQAPAAWQTNTAWASGAVTTGWTHAFAAGRWYLGVSALFRFTTGSYHVAVWEIPDQDTDGDGLGDAWEMYYFGNLTTANATSDYNGDGFPDLHAYVMSLSPTNALSIRKVSRAVAADQVTWTGASYGRYEIASSTNLLGPWTAVVDEYQVGLVGDSIVWTNLNASGDVRFYRISFRY